MRARLRTAFRGASPLLLLLAAFSAAVALPAVGSMFTTPHRAGDASGVFRAHVAWARVISVALAMGAAILLARNARDAPRTSTRGAIAFLALCATVGVAAALPTYDAWLADDVRARYATPGWEVQDHGGHSVELAFTLQREVLGATGTLREPLPMLAKGDHYVAFASFAGADTPGFWGARLEVADDPCFTSESQLPRSRDGPLIDTLFVRECTARGAAPRHITARWGEPDTPVDIRFGAIVRPVRAIEIEARADESLVLVSVLGGVGGAVAYALALRRARLPRLALATAPLLACALWAAGAVLPRIERSYPIRDMTAATAFALLALGIMGYGLARVVRALRHGGTVEAAVRASAFCAVAVAMLAPLGGARVWPNAVPWVVLGMVGSFLVGGMTLLAAGATLRADPRPSPTQV